MRRIKKGVMMDLLMDCSIGREERRKGEEDDSEQLILNSYR